jgi:hypothetical protein
MGGLSYEQTKIVVLKIADFHARWWEETNLTSMPWLSVFGAPAARQNFIKMYRDAWDSCAQEEVFRKALPDGGWETGLDICTLLPTLFDSLPNDKLTMYHRDLRADNMFFDWEKPQDPLVLFDWGLVRIGRGPNDLAPLLGYSLSVAVRQQIEKEMLKLYYDRLIERGVTGYSFDECMTDYFKALLYYSFAPFVQFQLAHDERGISLAKVSLDRMYRAVMDNNATRILS